MNTIVQIPQQKVGFAALFRNVFKRNFGIALLYVVLCFVCYPLILIMVVSSGNSYWATESAQPFIGVGLVLMGGLAVLFSMILSSRLYGFMHSRPAADVYHSMPVRRGTSFWINYLVGLILIIVPFAANVLITLLFYQGVFDANFIMDFFLMLLVSLLSITEFFTFCVFFHVTCGTGFGANLYNLMLNVGYVVAMGILSASLTNFLPGYAEFTMPITSILLLVPIGRVFSGWALVDTAQQSFGGQDVWIHLVLLVVLLLLSFFLYRIRKSEAAGSSFAFSLPKHVLRFIITSGGALFFSLIFYAIYVDGVATIANAFPIFLGAFIGGALTHIILEIIFSKGFGSLLKSLPAFAVFCVIFTAAYLLVANGWFGYDIWMPKAEDVKSVSISSYSSYDVNYEFDEEYGYEPEYADEEKQWSLEEKLMETAGLSMEMGYLSLEDQSVMAFSQTQNIETVLSLHRMAIQQATERKPYVPGGYTSPTVSMKNQEQAVMEVTLTYHLKNGKTITRTYYLPVNEQCKTAIDTLRYSSENLMYYLGFTAQSHTSFSHRIVMENVGGGTSLAVEEKQRAEFLDCLKADLESMSSSVHVSDSGDTIKVAVFVTVTHKAEYSVEYSTEYSEVWLNRLTINQAQFPKTYAFLSSYQTLNNAA